MWFWPLVILGILILAIVLFAQETADTGGVAAPGAEAGGAAAEQPTAEATAEEVAGNPQPYLGSVITVTGELEEVISPDAILIGSDGVPGGVPEAEEDELLVIGQEAFPAGISERQDDLALQVTGPVQVFNLAQFEQDWGIDLEDEKFTRHEGRPFILAQSLALTAGQEGQDRLGAAPGAGVEDTGAFGGVEAAPEGGTAAGAGELPAEPEADLSSIVGTTEAYYGDTVTVSGFVSRLVDSNAFSISPTPGAGEQGAVLVVASSEDVRGISPGDEVKIQGEVRSFNLEQYESEFGQDMDDILLGEWDQDPSLLAFSIQPIESPTAAGPQEPGAGGAPQDTSLLEQPQDTLLMDTLQ